MSANTTVVLEFLAVAAVKTYTLPDRSPLKLTTTNLRQAFIGSWQSCDTFPSCIILLFSWTFSTSFVSSDPYLPPLSSFSWDGPTHSIREAIRRNFRLPSPSPLLHLHLTLICRFLSCQQWVSCLCHSHESMPPPL